MSYFDGKSFLSKIRDGRSCQKLHADLTKMISEPLEQHRAQEMRDKESAHISWHSLTRTLSKAMAPILSQATPWKRPPRTRGAKAPLVLGGRKYLLTHTKELTLCEATCGNAIQNWHCRTMPSWVSHLFMHIPSDLLNTANSMHVYGTYYSSFGYPLKGFTLHPIVYRFERSFSKKSAQNDPEWSAMWTLLKDTQILYPKNLHNVHPKWRKCAFTAHIQLSYTGL